MSTRAREKSKKLIVCKERLNRLFEELDQLCRLYRETDALQVELELSLEEEERLEENDWSKKYRKGFRALALRSNGSEQTGRLDDQGIASTSGPEMVTAATSVHELAARLPRCDLPKFSGDFTEFCAFWDRFDYRVHQRKDLSNAAKLTYLHGCLTGKASYVISSLSSRNADYEVALNRLREEFDRPAKVIRHQIRKLVQSPLNDMGLSSQYDYLRRIVDALTALGKDPRKGGLREGDLFAAEITIAISRDRLPTPVQIKWDEKTCQNICSSWENKLHSWKSCGQIDQNPPTPQSPKPNVEAALSGEGTTMRRFSTLPLRISLPCAENRQEWQSSDLGRPMSHEKKKAQQWYGRCFYCQKHGHSKRNCPDRKSHPTASGRSASGVCNSDFSGPKAGKERMTIEPRKAQVNIATTEHGWSPFQIIKVVAHGAHGRKRLVNCLFNTGAERSLVRQDVADELKLAGEIHPISFCGVGGCQGNPGWFAFGSALSAENTLGKDTSVTKGLASSPVSEPDKGGQRADTSPCHHRIAQLSYPELVKSVELTATNSEARHESNLVQIKALSLLLCVSCSFSGIAIQTCVLSVYPQSVVALVNWIYGSDSYFRFLGTQVIRGGDDDPGTGMQGPLHQNGRSSERSPPEVLRVGSSRHPSSGDRKSLLGGTAVEICRDFGLVQDYMAVMQSYFENGWAEKASASSTPGKSAPPRGVPAGHYGKAEMSAGDATSRLGFAPPSAVHVRQKVYSLHRPQRIEVAQELPGT
ncbi:hypothetical protein T02_9341 [Trichinella nativa]|uniref:CCHC-type domain-containing protein n=1 Tax=Trichinella nativa TaxID=6335 RepID=A0A0V1L4Z4_9BILA|nr:hypothetical protein T02_9341 [Trichinella nativa]